jgi:hypothetical protein
MTKAEREAQRLARYETIKTYLAANGPTVVPELARKLRTDPNVMHHDLTRMAREGAVARQLVKWTPRYRRGVVIYSSLGEDPARIASLVDSLAKEAPSSAFIGGFRRSSSTAA